MITTQTRNELIDNHNRVKGDPTPPLELIEKSNYCYRFSTNFCGNWNRACEIKSQLPSDMTVWIHQQYDTWNEKEGQTVPCCLEGTCLNRIHHQCLERIFVANNISLRYVETTDTILYKAKNQRNRIVRYLDKELEQLNAEIELADERFETMKQELQAKMDKLDEEKRNWIRTRQYQELKLKDTKEELLQVQFSVVTKGELGQMGLNMIDLIDASDSTNAFTKFMTSENMTKVERSGEC